MWMIDQLAEERIAAAIDRGELEDLPGQGRAMSLEDDTHVPEELRAAYRVLRNSGFLPPELELRREIRSAEQLLSAAGNRMDRDDAGRRLTLLMARLSIARGHDVDLRVEQEYCDALGARFRR